MTHSVLLRRSAATAAVTALAMGAAAGTTASAASATTQAPVAASTTDPRLLGGVLDPVLGTVQPIIEVIDETTTVDEIVTILEPLSPLEVGGLLVLADPAQLTMLLGSLDPATLTAALDALDVTSLTGLIGGASGGDLTTLLGALALVDLAGVLPGLLPTDLTEVVGLLDPAQITALLALGDGVAPVTELIGGLTGVFGGLGGGAGDPLAALGQLTALLGGGLPTDALDLAALEGLLGTVSGLLGQLGVTDLPVLGGLLTVLTSSESNGAVDELVRTIETIISPGGTTSPGTTTPGTTTSPGTTPAPGTFVFLPGSTQNGGSTAGRAFRLPYRATIGRTTVTKNRKRARFTVTCPKSATFGCMVQASAMLAGKKVLKPRWVVLAGGRSTGVIVKMSKANVKRLKSKGGKITFRASTYGSSKSAATKSLTVKKPKKKKAAAKRR